MCEGARKLGGFVFSLEVVVEPKQVLGTRPAGLHGEADKIHSCCFGIGHWERALARATDPCQHDQRVDVSRFEAGVKRELNPVREMKTFRPQVLSQAA